jgi:hypothetical protein
MREQLGNALAHEPRKSRTGTCNRLQAIALPAGPACILPVTA